MGLTTVFNHDPSHFVSNSSSLIFCQILEAPNGPEPADWLGFDGWGRTWVCVFERDNSYLKLIRNEIHYEYVQLYILNRKFRNDKIGYLNPIRKNLWPTNWKIWPFKYGPFKLSTLLTWTNCNFFECDFSSLNHPKLPPNHLVTFDQVSLFGSDFTKWFGLC